MCPDKRIETVPAIAPKSPCTGICALDPETSLCRGCYRTLEEIAGWSGYTVEEKLAVLGKVAGRVAGPEGRRQAKSPRLPG